MKETPKSLVEQRAVLRQELLAQRQLLMRPLAAGPGLETDYPRSITMRLLLRRPALVARVLVGVLALLRAR